MEKNTIIRSFADEALLEYLTLQTLGNPIPAVQHRSPQNATGLWTHKAGQMGLLRRILGMLSWIAVIPGWLRGSG